MSDVYIRPATTDDLDAIGLIFRRSSLSNERDRGHLLAHPDALRFSETSVVEGRTRVAEVDGVRVGFATTEVGDDSMELVDLFVDPDHMRRGVGRSLVDDAVATTRKGGRTRLSVIANDHAMAFYLSVGFRAVGRVKTEFGSGERMHLDVDRS